MHLTTFLDFGGIERKKENLSAWKDDNEWVFVSINKGGVAEKKIEENGKRVVCLNLPYKIISLKTIFQLYKFLKEEKPNVLHTAGSEANFYGTIAAKFASVPVVCEDWGSDSQSEFANAVFKYIYSTANYVIAESAMVANKLLRRYKLPKNKIITIFNFINVAEPLFRDKVKEETSSVITVISVARLVRKKRIDISLNVFARLIKNGFNLKFLILGDGPLKAELQNHCDELRVSEHVDFLGFKESPLGLIENADIYLSTSDNEGFSNSLLEAMLMGLTSVTTRVGGVEDIIVNNHNGFIAEVNDEEDIFKNMKKALGLSEKERKEIGERAVKAVRDNFSLENHINELMKLYIKIK